MLQETESFEIGPLSVESSTFFFKVGQSCPYMFTVRFPVFRAKGSYFSLLLSYLVLHSCDKELPKIYQTLYSLYFCQDSSVIANWRSKKHMRHSAFWRRF